MQKASRWRTVLGIGAILALILMSLLLPRWGKLQQVAVVEAGRTFSFRDTGAGQYMMILQEGAPARGQGIVSKKVLEFRRSELIELTLSDLENGSVVSEGQVLAAFRSPRLDRQMEELRAMREILEADRLLLQAGGTDEEVREARKRLDLAVATRAGEQPQLERTRALAADGLVTEAELEAAILQDETRRLEIELARAALAVTRSSARPEALHVIDAEIGALDTRTVELEHLIEESQVVSPMAGTLEIGGRNNMLRVYDLETVYLRIPIPESYRFSVAKDDIVKFKSSALPDKTFEGTIVDLGENATNLNGQQIFWASAEVTNERDDRGLLLRSGMTGTVSITLHGRRPGMIRTICSELKGY